MFIRRAWVFPVLFFPYKAEQENPTHPDLAHVAFRPLIEAKNYGPVVRILDTKQNDKALIQHELTHAKQFYATLGLSLLFYEISPIAKYWMEIFAYRASIRAGLPKEKALQMMILAYDLNCNPGKINQDLGE